MTNIIVAKKYAKAAFDLANKLNLIDQFLSDLKTFSDNLSVPFVKELSNPSISKYNLSEVIIDLTKRMSLREEIIPFLSVVATSRRISEIKEIKNQFLKLVKDSRSILEVDVLSVCKLGEDNLNSIKKVLKKQYPNREIEINQLIKKDILGGVIIKVNSIIIDASLRNQLFLLQKQLKI